MREPKGYEAKVKEYVRKYATKESADAIGGEDGEGEGDEDEESEEEEMSDVGSFSEEEAAGDMEL